MASQRRREGRERGMGGGVCVDPYSGEIVALASYPTLNPNDRKNLSNTDAVRNNALGRVFEPGSIFKPITMSIALETGATSRSTTYKCKGTMKLFDKTMSDVHKRAHGVQNLEQVLMNSCNIGMSLMSMNVRSTRPTECCGSSASARKARSRWRARRPAS